MANKLSGRYCFEQDGYYQTYCIPIELKNQFNRLFKEIVMLKSEDLSRQEEKIELFNSIFANYRLEKSCSQYSFTDLQEIEE